MIVTSGTTAAANYTTLARLQLILHGHRDVYDATCFVFYYCLFSSSSFFAATIHLFHFIWCVCMFVCLAIFIVLSAYALLDITASVICECIFALCPFYFHNNDSGGHCYCVFIEATGTVVAATAAVIIVYTFRVSRKQTIFFLFE